MTQYLLSVHMVDGEELPPPDVIERMYADVDAVNEEIKRAGAWVFGGGLHPVETATVVREENGDVLLTDGPFRRDEGAPRRGSGSSKPPISTPRSPGPARRASPAAPGHFLQFGEHGELIALTIVNARLLLEQEGKKIVVTLPDGSRLRDGRPRRRARGCIGRSARAVVEKGTASSRGCRRRPASVG